MGVVHRKQEIKWTSIENVVVFCVMLSFALQSHHSKVRLNCDDVHNCFYVTATRVHVPLCRVAD